jgi:hypothetical protein
MGPNSFVNAQKGIYESQDRSELYLDIGHRNHRTRPRVSMSRMRTPTKLALQLCPTSIQHVAWFSEPIPVVDFIMGVIFETLFSTHQLLPDI